MIIRDPAGNVLKEGDEIIQSTGFGQSMVGTIVKIDAGLANLNPNQPQPGFVLVQLLLPLAIAPNGQVGGIFKLHKQETSVGDA